MVYITGCASTIIRPNCADDSIVAATIWHLRTGDKTYIQKSGAGDHAQAYAVINGVDTPIHVFPLFGWYVEKSVEDNMKEKGSIYSVYDFIKLHGFR